MDRMMWPIRSLLTLALVMAGCAQASRIAQVPATIATEIPLGNPDLAKTVHPAAPGEGGTVKVTVRWPARTVQIIPLSTEQVEVSLLTGSATLSTAVLQRATPGVDLPTSATLSRIPSGTYTLWASARATGGLEVARGTMSVVVRTKRISEPRLTLTPVNVPRITGLSSNGSPSSTGTHATQISLFGSGFRPNATATTSVYAGNLALESSRLQVDNTMIVIFGLPTSLSGTIRFHVVVDGVRNDASEDPAFTLQAPLPAIRAVRITPATASLATNQTQTFTGTAYSDLARTTPVTGATFRWTLKNAPPPLTVGGVSPFTIDPFSGVFMATATGSAEVVGTCSGLEATASVNVDTIGAPATPAPGPGPGGGAAPF